MKCLCRIFNLATDFRDKIGSFNSVADMTQKQRGRPAQGPIARKSSNFATRVTAPTREALDRESERLGRSKSQIAEVWLDEARELHDVGMTAPAVADAIRTMVRFAARVSQQVGDPGETQVGRTALIAGWIHIVENALPFTPHDANECGLRDLAAQLGDDLPKLADEVNALIANAYGDPSLGRRVDADWGPDDARAGPTPSIDPVAAIYLHESLPNVIDARRNGVLSTKISLARLAYDVVRRPSRATEEALKTLEDGLIAMRAAGPSLSEETSDILKTLRAFRTALADYQAKHAVARKNGEALAAALAGSST